MVRKYAIPKVFACFSPLLSQFIHQAATDAAGIQGVVTDEVHAFQQYRMYIILIYVEFAVFTLCPVLRRPDQADVFRRGYPYAFPLCSPPAVHTSVYPRFYC